MLTNECQLAHAFPSPIPVELTKSLKGEIRELDFLFFLAKCASMMTPRKCVRAYGIEGCDRRAHVTVIRMRKHDGDSSGRRTQIIRIVCVSVSVSQQIELRRAHERVATHTERLNHRVVYIHSETYMLKIYRTRRFFVATKSQKCKSRKWWNLCNSKSNGRAESRRARNNNNSADYHWRMRKVEKKKWNIFKLKIEKKNSSAHRGVSFRWWYDSHYYIFVLYLSIYF